MSNFFKDARNFEWCFMWTYNVGGAFKKGQPFSDQRWQKLDNTSWLSYCLLYSYNIKDSINTQYILAHRSITHGLLTQWDHVTRCRNTGLAKSQQAGLTFSISMQSLINGRGWNPPSPPLKKKKNDSIKSTLYNKTLSEIKVPIGCCLFYWIWLSIKTVHKQYHVIVKFCLSI